MPLWRMAYVGKRLIKVCGVENFDIGAWAVNLTACLRVCFDISTVVARLPECKWAPVLLICLLMPDHPIASSAGLSGACSAC